LSRSTSRLTSRESVPGKLFILLHTDFDTNTFVFSFDQVGVCVYPATDRLLTQIISSQIRAHSLSSAFHWSFASQGMDSVLGPLPHISLLYHIDANLSSTPS
jgi:hypothetical protein